MACSPSLVGAMSAKHCPTANRLRTKTLGQRPFGEEVHPLATQDNKDMDFFAEVQPIVRV